MEHAEAGLQSAVPANPPRTFQTRKGSLTCIPERFRTLDMADASCIPDFETTTAVTSFFQSALSHRVLLIRVNPALPADDNDDLSESIWHVPGKMVPSLPWPT